MSGAGPVLLVGIPSEPPLERVRVALERLGRPYALWNQREVLETHVAVHLDEAGRASGRLAGPFGELALESVSGVYLRPADSASLPELAGLGPDDPARAHAAEVLDLLLTWSELTDARVVNRFGGLDSNASKPYQAQLIAETFLVPETLVTDEPEEAMAFWARHGRLIYKSVSGERSVVQELTEGDLPRLEALRACPVQLQELIEGQDVRVHALVSGEVFATAVASGAVDYRYPDAGAGQGSQMWPVALADETAADCVALTARLGLEFSGIDLKITPEGAVYCLEVNPSPGYSAFEEQTGQPISHALACHLSGGADGGGGGCGCGCG